MSYLALLKSHLAEKRQKPAAAGAPSPFNNTPGGGGGVPAPKPLDWWARPVEGWPEKITIHNMSRDETRTIALSKRGR